MTRIIFSINSKYSNGFGASDRKGVASNFRVKIVTSNLRAKRGEKACLHGYFVFAILMGTFICSRMLKKKSLSSFCVLGRELAGAAAATTPT